MRFLLFALRTFGTTIAILAVIDACFRFAFPHFLRLQTDFSATYLARELAPSHVSGRVVFLGDSALWGYKVPAEQAAVSQLIRSGVPALNLSYEGGSLPNSYAILTALLARGDKPSGVIFNVNLKEFNAADSAYATLHPAVERLVWPLLTDQDRARLQKKLSNATIDARVDSGLSAFWALYGMRTDLRDEIFGDSDAASYVRDVVNRLSGEEYRVTMAHRPTADRFLGTYDLSPLSDANTGVYFLRQLAGLIRANKLRAVAILTPTNHVLLHDYIDVPEYQSQLAFVAKIASSNGIRVLNYDDKFPAADFIDNDHLDTRAQAVLAQSLRRDLGL